MSTLSSLKTSWKIFLESKKRKLEFITSLILLALVLISFSQFLLFIEEREGVILFDPLLNLFDPIDLTWLTFTLIYLSLIMALIQLIKNPQSLLLAIQCYGLMVILRAIAMYLAPLEAPSALIPLNDPFVQLFGEGQILEKDLFFSGHTATLFLLFLLMKKPVLKIVFLVFTFSVAVAVILQHVHYSIDVFAAPFFAYTSFRIVSLFNEEKTKNEE